VTWTYDGSPGTSTAAERRDAVRLLIGDTDTNDQQVTDEEITFALAQTGDDIYLAAAVMARTLAGKYARQVDSKFDALSISNGQRAQQYLRLATQMEKESKKRGNTGLGTPLVGGISQDDVDSVRDDEDRVDPRFRMGQFQNPPGTNDKDIRYD
jgi:hypothetical protein